MDGKPSDENKVCKNATISSIRRTISLSNVRRARQTPSSPNSPSHDHLWELTASYLPRDVKSISQLIANHVEYTLACQRHAFNTKSAYHATALSLRDRMIEFWNDTQDHFIECGCKMMFYMSIEYLIGRSLTNAVMHLDLWDPYTQAVRDIGFTMENLQESEEDAALGSGGLGRLAACYLDSLATMNYPAWGYGIRYQFGMFKQMIINGQQVETPEYWLEMGNPWEILRNDVNYEVRFGGGVTTVVNGEGFPKCRWEGGGTVRAIAYDMPVPGYGTINTLNLRLWSSKPTNVFDLEQFNREEQYTDYWQSLHDRQRDESICKVLYPKNSTAKGQELRLKQQYFFSSATLQDIMSRFKHQLGGTIERFPDLTSIQLNDTHPSISIVELMRLLVDIEGVDWDSAWSITTRTFSFTNHTVLPEALETWPVPLLQSILPRHLQIIYEINSRFLSYLKSNFNLSDDELSRLSIVEEANPKRIRMANLAIIGSHKVNGVAALHTEILKNEVFKEFYKIWPDKFLNITNGVTPRRWILQCNPKLASVLTQYLGSNDWVTDLSKIKRLKEIVTPSMIEAFAVVKLENKRKLRELILRESNDDIDVDPDALFDVQIKRIHEYKRQLLNILGVVHRYLELKSLDSKSRAKIVPRVKIFAGKAAPGYETAKAIIQLICAVAAVVNKDKDTRNWLKVVFLPNYSVSLAEAIIPANDISEHISTAGTEASGTSNMKFVMNAGLILGTRDGANIEITNEVGEENMFMFGSTKDEVDAMHLGGTLPIDERLFNVLKVITDGMFGNATLFRALLDSIWKGNDYFAVAMDFPKYLKAQRLVDEIFRDRNQWVSRCVRATSAMGKFSSDRSIGEYAEKIWQLKPHEMKHMSNAEFQSLINQ